MEKSGLKFNIPFAVASPPIFCGSSSIIIGLFAFITSIGLREPNSSRLE